MSNPNPPASTPPGARAPTVDLPPPARAPVWFVALGLVALVAYGFFIGRHATVAAGGSDSSGYLNSGRLLATGRLEIPVRLPPAFAAENPPLSHFQPLGFVSFDHGARLVPTYPTGLPLHFAFAARVAGWTWGPRLVEISGAVAGLWLCFATARAMGLGRPLAVTATVILGACPVMLFAATQPLSDMLATTWCLAAVWAALRARARDPWALACGLAYGVAVLVRPTNAVLLPALLVLLGFQPRRLSLGAVGGLPCVAWLAAYNHLVYGGPFRSGYFNWSEFFALQHAVPATTFFLQWLSVFLPAVLLVLPFAAIARREIRSRELLALALWCVPIVALYALVEFSHEAWTCLRYILPALPALIIAGLLGVEGVARVSRANRATLVRRWGAFVLSAWAIGVSSYWSPRNAVFHIKHHEDAYISSAHAARTHFPTNSLVLSCHTTGALYHYTDFPILRFDGLDPATFARYVELAKRTGVAMTALLFSGEEQMALRENCPGPWARVATVDGVGIWRLAAIDPKPAAQ